MSCPIRLKFYESKEVSHFRTKAHSMFQFLEVWNEQRAPWTLFSLLREMFFFYENFFAHERAMELDSKTGLCK